MTSPTHSTPAETAAQMPRTTGPKPPALPPSDAEAQAAPVVHSATTARQRAWEQVGDNPLQALFAAAIIALLTFTLTSTHARFGDINARFEDVNTRFDDVNTRFDDVNTRFDDVNTRFDDVNTRFDEVNARITRLEDKVDDLGDEVSEINLKLTALIAALNKTGEVSAALEGRIIDNSEIADPASASDRSQR